MKFLFAMFRYLKNRLIQYNFNFDVYPFYVNTCTNVIIKRKTKQIHIINIMFLYGAALAATNLATGGNTSNDSIFNRYLMSDIVYFCIKINNFYHVLISIALMCIYFHWTIYLKANIKLVYLIKHLLLIDTNQKLFRKLFVSAYYCGQPVGMKMHRFANAFKNICQLFVILLGMCAV